MKGKRNNSKVIFSEPWDGASFGFVYFSRFSSVIIFIIREVGWNLGQEMSGNYIVRAERLFPSGCAVSYRNLL